MTTLIHKPRAGELAERPPPSRHPVVLYLSKLAPTSVKSMKSGLNSVARMVNKSATCMTLPWHEMRREHAAAIRSVMVETWAPRTINKTLSAVRGVLHEVWALGDIDHDTYQRVRSTLKNVHATDLPPAGRTLPTEEIAKLYEACSAKGGELGMRDAALITVLYAAGLRREEACSLNVGHYDSKTAALRVKGKGKKSRTAYLPDAYRQGIEPWLEHRRKQDAEHLFPRFRLNSAEAGRRLGKDGVNHILRELHERAGVEKFTPHDLRRSFATHLLDNDADILMVQKLMGHSQLSTTAIYDRRGEKGKQKAITKLPPITFPTTKG